VRDGLPRRLTQELMERVSARVSTVRQGNSWWHSYSYGQDAQLVVEDAQLRGSR